ncbi:unnamed protein product [Moneuplotes crassus]|uniref:Uncharacterized protein n=1 Tax=Euplotes crassus TaxID=5936 RepID=A0AAD1XUG4_EUPCR|nr:unnamed protein product [Moneuplotes crassus]
MEAQEDICIVKGCIFRPICCWNEEDEQERFCIWHWNWRIKKFMSFYRDKDLVGLYEITKKDMRFLEEASKVFGRVFDRKEKSEKDQFSLRIYSLINKYLKKSFESLRKKFKDCKRYLEKCNHERKKSCEEICDISNGGLKKRLMKERFLKAKDIYFNSNLLSRYLDPETLFELLSVSNDNIGQLSLCNYSMSAEETKEDTCFSFCEEIRSCILRAII